MLQTKNDRKIRRKVFRRNSGRSSVASRNTRDHLYRKYRSHEHRGRSRSEDNRYDYDLYLSVRCYFFHHSQPKQLSKQ